MASKQTTSMLRVIRKAVGPYRDGQASDRELLRRFAEQRDEDAFAALVRRHGAMVLGVGLRVLRHYQNAEDVCQATFLLLAQKAGAVPWRDSVANWLYGAAYRLALQTRDAGNRRNARDIRFEPRPTPDAMADVTLRELQAILDEELTRLPRKYSAPLILCCLEGKSRDEAAQCLGLSLATVKSRLEAGREMLRLRLARRGLTLSVALAGITLASDAARAALPALLVRAMSSAALKILGGQATAGVVSANVMAIIQGGVQAMFLTKVKVATALLLAVGLVTTGIIAQAKNWPMPGQAKAPAKARTSDSNEKPRPDAEAAPRRVRAPAEDRTETVTHRGRVVGPDGRPVPGAKLYLTLAVGYSMKPSSSPVYATTGPDGGFNFTVTKTKFGDQSTDLAAAAPNYGAGWVAVGKDTSRDDLTLQLVADDVPITGQVIDLEGKPVPGATLRVLQINAAPGEDLGPWLDAVKDKKAPDRDRSARLEQEYLPRYTAALSPAVTTAADGRFRLTGIGRNRLVLAQLDGPTLASQYLRILTRPGNTIEVPGYKGDPESRIPRRVTTYYGTSFRHVAAPTKPIVGAVRDKETKKPLAGVKIQSFTLATRPNHMDHIIETTTDADGRYQLRGMPKGDGNKIMLVPPHDQPYLPVHAKVPDSPGLDPVTVDFALKRGVWIEGKIIDKVTGKPLKAGAEYFALWTNPNVRDYEGYDGTVLIGGNGSSGHSDGTYRVVGLPGPGLVVVWRVDDYVLALERDDEFRIGKKGLSTAPYQLLPLENYGAFARTDPPKGADSVKREVTLDPGWTFTGSVLGPDGKPLAGTRSNGLTGWGWGKRKGTETAEFTVGGFNPRRPRDLIFRHQEMGLVALAQPPKENGGTVTVRMQPGARVTGRLVDAAGRQRAGVELEVSFRLKDDSRWCLQYSPKRIKTDRRGRFEIEALLPGYEFRLSDGESELPLGGPLRLGQTKDLGDVRLKPSH